MLRTALQSHPNLFLESEVFLFAYDSKYFHFLPNCPPQRFANEPEYAAVCCMLLGRDKAASGFTLFYEQMRGPDRVGLWPFLGRFPDLHVIHLMRRQTFMQWLSLREALVSDTWSVLGDTAVQHRPPIQLNRIDYHAWLNRHQSDHAFAMNHLGHQRMLDVYYEDLVDHYAETIERVLSFLGADKMAVQPSCKKMGTRSMVDRIANFDEFVASMKGRPGEASLLEAIAQDAERFPGRYSGSSASSSGS